MTFTEYFIGKREQISWAEESSFGTGVTPTDIVGYNVTINPTFTRGWQEILAGGDDTRAVNSYVVGPKDLRFTIEFIPVDWKFLKYVYGTVADLGSDPYTHTFTLNNAVKSFTLEWAKRGATNHVITLDGCSVLSCKLAYSKATSAGSEGHIKVTLDCVAQDYTKGTSITSISAPTTTPFQYRMVKLTLNGNEIKEVNSGELNISTGIEINDSRYCNSTYDETIGETIPKTFRISGRSNINLKDRSLFDLWDAGTAIAGACKLEFVRGSNDDIDFTFGTVYPDESTAPTNIEGVTNVDFSYTITSIGTSVATDSTSTY